MSFILSAALITSVKTLFKKINPKRFSLYTKVVDFFDCQSFLFLVGIYSLFVTCSLQIILISQQRPVFYYSLCMSRMILYLPLTSDKPISEYPAPLDCQFTG